ncbi:6771_t:CDS:1 [Funneliformis geosporum]|uniref:2214_t:CDS:1 n=1 Tax=Funneliformis geosporum TaxID=1117311 RepID=A0A9W4SS72_9GLOM|nr:6771_t:CDS:1 [Funneliformis geosporum]CAI2179485.1 2214_t:CDS:1 [Funneliformis geosporum]
MEDQKKNNQENIKTTELKSDSLKSPRTWQSSNLLCPHGEGKMFSMRHIEPVSSKELSGNKKVLDQETLIIDYKIIESDDQVNDDIISELERHIRELETVLYITSFDICPNNNHNIQENMKTIELKSDSHKSPHTWQSSNLLCLHGEGEKSSMRYKEPASSKELSGNKKVLDQETLIIENKIIDSDAQVINNYKAQSENEYFISELEIYIRILEEELEENVRELRIKNERLEETDLYTILVPFLSKMRY